jgi:hypothetical protein
MPIMQPWFRFYDDAVTDPKVQLLSDKLFKFWVNILCLANKNNGELPSATHIAYALHETVDVAKEACFALLQSGLLDRFDGNVLRPHNWSKRQPIQNLSTPRVKRFRKRQQTVSETAEKRTEREKEREKERDRTMPLQGNGSISQIHSQAPPSSARSLALEAPARSPPSDGLPKNPNISLEALTREREETAEKKRLEQALAKPREEWTDADIAIIQIHGA